MDRRFFLHLSAMAAAASLIHWRFNGYARASDRTGRDHDAVVVGAGLGGLCCAAHLARSGFKTLLLEQYGEPGGYATSFKRLGKDRVFTCEISLHSSAFYAPGMRGMLTELGVWDKLALAKHPHAWSSRFPGFSLDIPAAAGLDGFEGMLAGLFPEEAKGLADYFTLWRGVLDETARLDKGLPDLGKSSFADVFTHLWAIHDKTIGQVVDAHIRNPRLRAVLTQSCGYYGLPPSQLSAFYYLLPTGEYLQYGGAYIKGTSRVLSEALAHAVTDAGGEIRYGKRVTSILVRDGRAVGVKTRDGEEFRAKAVVCNASAPQVFGSLVPAGSLPQEEQARIATYSDSPSSFIVWLGLGQDITKDVPDPETNYYAGTDSEAAYKAGMACDFAHSSFSVMVYDNLVPGFSPPGCTTVSVMALSGYDHWKGFEADYLAGQKQAYHAEKKRLTELLIRLAEERAIPGLSRMIIMRESSTPLTNLRFTLNRSGSIYGYNQTVDNSFMTRSPNTTGLPGLYLASAWGSPGGGYGGALMGGKAAFRAVAQQSARTAP